MSAKGTSYDKKCRKKPCKKACPQKPRNDCKPDLRGRTERERSRDLSPRRTKSKPLLPMEGAVSRRRDQRAQANEARAQGRGSCRHGKGRTPCRNRKTKVDSLRPSSRTSLAQKKRAIGLYGSLIGRHLSLDQRRALLKLIDEATANGESIQNVCEVLEVNRRAVYRWRDAVLSPPKPHGGGGGLNKLQPKEERAVIKIAQNNPHWRCRRLA